VAFSDTSLPACGVRGGAEQQTTGKGPSRSVIAGFLRVETVALPSCVAARALSTSSIAASVVASNNAGKPLRRASG
jgi:hypothetical protein